MSSTVLQSPMQLITDIPQSLKSEYQVCVCSDVCLSFAAAKGHLGSSLIVTICVVKVNGSMHTMIQLTTKSLNGIASPAKFWMHCTQLYTAFGCQVVEGVRESGEKNASTHENQGSYCTQPLSSTATFVLCEDSF